MTSTFKPLGNINGAIKLSDLRGLIKPTLLTYQGTYFCLIAIKIITTVLTCKYSSLLAVLIMNALDGGSGDGDGGLLLVFLACDARRVNKALSGCACAALTNQSVEQHTYIYK